MAIFSIEGNQLIRGEVTVSGAKNSATKLLAASMLSTKEVVFHNFPDQLEDVKEKVSILREMGALIDSKNNFVAINSANVKPCLVKEVCTIRTTYLLAPFQLHRFGYALIPYPGGCKIGDRKYDLHIMVWEKMGCVVHEHETHIEIKCNRSHLQGTDLFFPFPTIGGTESAIMCAVLAHGRTTISNAYISPEVEDLIMLLRNMGADITQRGNSYIEINGVHCLNGASHNVIPDRIEALTWIILGLISNSKLTIREVPFKIMEVPLIHMKHIGLDYYSNSDSIYIDSSNSNNFINPFEVACGTYPGIITDMQPLFAVLASQASGSSRIIDYRYPNRFQYIKELEKLGGNFKVSSGEVQISGKVDFRATRLDAVDLRGGAAVLLASIIASGVSEISNFNIVLRGYNRLLSKLSEVGLKFNLSQTTK